MQRLNFLSATFAFMLIAAASSPAATISDAEHRYNDLLDFSKNIDKTTSLEKSRRIHAEYKRLFDTPKKVSIGSPITDTDLEFAFRAAELTAFYTLDADDVRAAETAYIALSDRGLAQERHREDLYKTFVAARQFDKATDLATGHPTLSRQWLPPADTSEPKGPTAWALSKPEMLAMRVPVETDRPALIVIVSHPDCSFSARAARDIAQDARLAPLLAHNAIWLMPQSAQFDFDRLARWQAVYPTMRSMITHKRSEFSWMRDWDTPTFYFLKNGRVVHTVIGWPKDGSRKADVVAGLKMLGLDQSADARPVSYSQSSHGS